MKSTTTSRVTRGTTRPERAATRAKRKPAAERSASIKEKVQRVAALSTESGARTDRPRPSDHDTATPEQEQRKAYEATLEDFGLELSKILAGPRYATGEVNAGSIHDGQPAPRGITLEELSGLLIAREQLGESTGWRKASDGFRRDLQLALQRERNETAAGTMFFVLEQLAGPVERLAVDVGSEQAEDARLELVELMAAISRHANRLSRGEHQLSASGRRIA